MKDQSISKTELVRSIVHSPSHEGIPVMCILHILLRWSLSRDLSQRSLTEFFNFEMRILEISSKNLIVNFVTTSC